MSEIWGPAESLHTACRLLVFARVCLFVCFNVRRGVVYLGIDASLPLLPPQPTRLSQGELVSCVFLRGTILCYPLSFLANIVLAQPSSSSHIVPPHPTPAGTMVSLCLILRLVPFLSLWGFSLVACFVARHGSLWDLTCGVCSAAAKETCHLSVYVASHGSLQDLACHSHGSIEILSFVLRALLLN